MLLWFDDFDGPAGQLPNPNKWGYDIGTDWGNAQLEYDTDRPSNVSLDGNGNLAIVAREESYMGQPYTSARIVTRDLYEPTYGRVEARIKLPAGQGIWPAFWLLGSNLVTVGWPQCGEIDIMEMIGQQANTIFGSLHGPGYSGANALSQIYTLDSGQFNDGFHVFAVEWDTSAISWFVDDTLYLTIQPELLGSSEWVFDHSFYIILNIAVGGNFVGAPDLSTVFPQSMLIDYVRVYQTGPDDVEHEITLDENTMNSGHWVSIDLTLSDFTNLTTKEHLAQLVISGDPNTMYVDNIFLYHGSVPSAPPVAAPVPTYPSGDVISMFSDTYTDVTVDTWSAVWDNADVEDYMVNTDRMKKYSNLIFAGIECVSSTIDASEMTHFRVDVWTPESTAPPAQCKIKLVDFGADGVWGGPGSDDVEHELAFDANSTPAMTTGSWITLDIPLIDFANLITTGHLAQLIISGDLPTVFIDNVLFHK